MRCLGMNELFALLLWSLQKILKVSLISDTFHSVNEDLINFLNCIVLMSTLFAANAEFIKMADLYVPVPGGSNNNNYANVELILNIAIRNQVQVH